MINETMARQFWPDQDPIGTRFDIDPDDAGKSVFTIIGVIADVHQMGLNERVKAEMYFPYWQAKNNWMVPRDLVVLTAGDPLSLAGAVRRAVWSVDPNQPVSNVQTMDEVLDDEVLQRRIEAALLGVLAAVALVLACAGIYGVLSCLVTQRTREIGVRVALGANTPDDPLTYLGASLAFAVVALLACCLPAYRASKVDPLVALRHE